MLGGEVLLHQMVSPDADRRPGGFLFSGNIMPAGEVSVIGSRY
jgi:hypothetical protein